MSGQGLGSQAQKLNSPNKNYHIGNHFDAKPNSNSNPNSAISTLRTLALWRGIHTFASSFKVSSCTSCGRVAFYVDLTPDLVGLNVVFDIHLYHMCSPVPHLVLTFGFLSVDDTTSHTILVAQCCGSMHVIDVRA